MLYEELLDIAGFNGVEKNRLISLSYRFPEIKEYAKKYMEGAIPYKWAVRLTESLKTAEASDYALDLVLICHAFAMLKDKYEEKGISDEIFADSARDLLCKTRECIAVNGDIGTVSVYWFEPFLDLRRFALGRLQFTRRKFPFDTYEKNGYKVEKFEDIIDCHIPSGAPLTQEMCFDSYKKAYNFFSDLWKDGVAKIYCGSYLFYPKYREVFGENTRLFAGNFDIFKVEEYDSFKDSWRVFDTHDISNLDALPTTTSTQRRFIEYIKNGGTHGHAEGVIIFDGEKIVNK